MLVPMTHEQLAAQVWQVLVLAARNQQILSYAALEEVTGVPGRGLAPILSKVEHYCKDKGFPHLTAVVVSQASGFPGHLFPGYAEAEKDLELVREPGLHGLRIIQEQARTFVFEWTEHLPPSEHDFADVRKS